MEALVEFAEGFATIRGWKWTSDNVSLQELLNTMLNNEGPSPSDPQPEINEARRVAKELSGTVVKEIPYPPGKPGTVY